MKGRFVHVMRDYGMPNHFQMVFGDFVNGIPLYGVLDWKEREINSVPPREAYITITQEIAQTLMDELWNCNIRPTDVGTAGHVASVTEHKNELSSIVDRLFKRYVDK